MKVLKILFVLILIFFINQTTVFASDKFMVDSSVEYKVLENGDVNVTNTIKIKNQKSEVFPKGYSLSFNKYFPINLKVYENGNLLKVDHFQNGDNYNYLINFENLDVGLENTKIFLITYEINSFAKKTGDMWEINIPYRENFENYSSYLVSLIVPNSFGHENFLSIPPNLIKKDKDTSKYVFTNKDISIGSIYVSFGEFQTYDFNITYHLENPLEQKSYSEIAIIPDTKYQRVYYKNIDPKPVKIYKDIDGNWMAGFNFKPREKIEINTSGFVQVFNTSIDTFSNYSMYYLENTLKEDIFWEVNDPVIVNISNSLKNARDIYNYLIFNMSYDENKTNNYKFERIGARRALELGNQSLCLEFTDSFIALARAKNIPAREINGYAVTDNKDTKPIFLVSDVLHAWPEYWDSEKETFIPIDPTWGKTSGMNYFDNFDMKHIVFAIHGTNSQLPYSAGTYKLGSDPKKDILISSATNPPKKNPENVDIYYKSRGFTNPLFEDIDITITNNGDSALYRVKLEAILKDMKLKEETIPELLPFSSFSTTLRVNYKLFGIGMPDHINFKVGGSITSLTLHKIPRLIIQVLFVFVFLSLSLIFIYRYIYNLLKHRHA